MSEEQCDQLLRPLAIYPCGDRDCAPHWVEQEWQQVTIFNKYTHVQSLTFPCLQSDGTPGRRSINHPLPTPPRSGLK